ncbi:sigma-70 family RNA polymerase sigma factor [Streptomyces sp. NPDC002403]
MIANILGGLIGYSIVRRAVCNEALAAMLSSHAPPGAPMATAVPFTRDVSVERLAEERTSVSSAVGPSMGCRAPAALSRRLSAMQWHQPCVRSRSPAMDEIRSQRLPHPNSRSRIPAPATQESETSMSAPTAVPLLSTTCTVNRPQQASSPSASVRLALRPPRRGCVDPVSPPHRTAATTTRRTHPSAAADPDTPDKTEEQAPPLTPQQRTAFIEQLYAENARYLTTLLLPRVGGDRQTAEDIVQETMLRAWSNAEKLSAEPEFTRPWLITVAKNLLIDLHRRRQCRPKETAYNPSWPSHVPTSTDISGRVLSALTVQQTLRKLTPQQSDIVRRVYLMEHSLEEVATALDIPRGTVKSRLFYALRAMGQILTRADAHADLTQ